ncbi:penicillin-binding protein activator LpoB [Helicobacter didelphidarum]|uniref:Penicillin-binding protein activator LpoB n=1 Tax=Helicobacter didelphidarum TaxID=2040648 RepID=A0A3D8IKY7_9HELI|nr:penicillin-binding protein activator LpoB [Helicobacter didelphidarum]RDU66007.1 penicillin-binding protein activator LpoB [Helicobacter didelphidarum]
MKNLIKFAFVGLVGISIIGCGGKVAYVDTQDSVEYTSTGIDYHDIESAVHKSVQSLLNSEYVLDLEGKKVLAISDVINDTMQQVDVQGLTTKIARAMRKSGKFELTTSISGSGGITDNMIQKSRGLRENEEFNQYTTQEKGNLIAPSLSLSGKIVQKNTRVGKKQRIDYSFLLILTDLKTGVVKWDESTHIIKVAPNNKVSW